VQYASSFEPGLVFATAFAIVIAIVKYQGSKENKAIQEANDERRELKLEEIRNLLKNADPILKDRLSYYRSLSDDGKLKFKKRLQYVIANKQFYGKEGLKLTDEMQIITAAAFVQITFGFKNYGLDRFDKIAIYPNIFYNKLLDRNLRGSTSPVGVIRFSWRHIEVGYANEDDNINLAIHELAHALKVSVDEYDETDGHLMQELEDFLESGSEVRNAILNGKLELIRKYASVNAHEFFACCSEYFFESPYDFKERLPTLYRKISEVYHQDLTWPEADYAFNEFEPRVKVRRREKQRISTASVIEANSEWVQWIIITGLFLGTPLSIYFSLSLESTAFTILLFFGTIIIGGLILFYRRFLMTGFMNGDSFGLFLFAGWLPTIAAGALILNSVVPVYSFEVIDTVDGTYIYQKEFRLATEPVSSLRAVRDGLQVNRSSVRWVNEHVPNVVIRSKVHYGILGLKVYDSFSLELTN
jgi:MtfA peptidase